MINIQDKEIKNICYLNISHALENTDMVNVSFSVERMSGSIPMAATILVGIFQ